MLIPHRDPLDTVNVRQLSILPEMIYFNGNCKGTIDMIEESSSKNSGQGSPQKAGWTRVRKSSSDHVPRTQSATRQLLPFFLFAGILCAAGIGVFLVRWDSQSTPDSQLFASTDQFDELSAIVPVVTGAAAAVAGLTLPSFVRVARKSSRIAVTSAILLYALCGATATLGPILVEGGNGSFIIPHFYLRVGLIAAVLLVAGAGPFGGLVLLRYAQNATVTDGDKATKIVVPDILFARREMQRFFTGSTIIITGIVFIVGGLRSTLNAYSEKCTSSHINCTVIVNIPTGGLVLYGIFFAGLLAFALIPAYSAWQSRVARFRDHLYPLPDNGPPSKDWYEGRARFEDLAGMQLGSTSRFLAIAGVLAPLIGSIITATLHS